MARLALKAGDRVRLTSEHGQVEVNVAPAKGDELPEGLLFIAYGDVSCRLMGADTHGSGMPTSKGIDVTLEVL
jgi:formylmethanofuran dehydrogenase subunit D